MRNPALTFAAAWLVGTLLPAAASAQPADPRLREIWYDPQAVVTVPVKRGVVTDIVLDASEAITDVASGLGGDCGKPDGSWCIAAQPGGRHIFVKPKSTATAPNNLAVVTDKRTHSFRLEVLADSDQRSPVYRLSVRAAAPRVSLVAPPQPFIAPSPLAPEATPPSPAEVIVGRLSAAPTVVNTNYSIAEGAGSHDIVPSLIFDDGRFTYLRFAHNREVPAVFHVLGDGSEALVNFRMEGDLLVVDRISRQLTLRAGSAVVGLWNEAFDPDGVAPKDGTTVSGVARALKSLDGPSTHGARP
jgi:type IV secretion system protein VirB9